MFRRHQDELGHLSRVPARVVKDIITCRTAALGGHILRCDHCRRTEISYNSCRNRHCPKCQSLARAKWLEDRKADLLPVQYFHLVFTIPHVLNPLVLRNKRVVYNILFRAVSETLREVAANPKRLGAEVGFTTILHTWSQTLLDHPHLHCVVPGGGISPDGTRWIHCPDGFFLPVRVLSDVFRGKFLDYLGRAYRQEQLEFPGMIEHLVEPEKFKQLLHKAANSGWVVYSKKPFSGPEQVFEYLGWYTHRVAISNRRLVSMQDGRVSFRWRDYAGGNVLKTMSLEASEFMRRFLLHVLPRGFVRIRHYGLLSNRSHKTKIPLCRMLLGKPCSDGEKVRLEIETWQELMLRLTGVDVTICPHCSQGHMIKWKRLLPKGFDSS